MIIQMNEMQLTEYRNQLVDLFGYCKFASSGIRSSIEFCENKINELFEYLRNNKAYLLVDLENKEIRAFLWACVVNRDNESRFHVLYLAVKKKYQSIGIGKALMEAAEKQAAMLGIEYMELNVHASNLRAEKFYSKQGYVAERITMKKLCGK